jgi:transcriptional regulator with XRE-family HTH domain
MPTLGDCGGFLTRLQRERHARDWTQQEAIDRLKRLAHERGYGQRFDGLDSNTLSRYERGRIRRPRAPLPELFAALYEVSVEELFPRRKPAVAAWARPARHHGGLRVMVGGELVEVVIPPAGRAVGQPVVRVGSRPIDASAAPLLDSTVAVLVASARVLLAVTADAVPGELGGQISTDG